jgi:hypothetical protein
VGGQLTLRLREQGLMFCVTASASGGLGAGLLSFQKPGLTPRPPSFVPWGGGPFGGAYRGII